MSKNKIVFFYEREIEKKIIDNISYFTGDCIFIQLVQLKQDKSTLRRFLENEIKSIPPLTKFFSIFPIAKILEYLISPIKFINRNSLPSTKGFKKKVLSN